MLKIRRINENKRQLIKCFTRKWWFTSTNSEVFRTFQSIQSGYGCWDSQSVSKTSCLQAQTTIPLTQNSESVAHYEQLRTLHSSNPLLLLRFFCFLNLYELTKTSESSNRRVFANLWLWIKRYNQIGRLQSSSWLEKQLFLSSN